MWKRFLEYMTIQPEPPEPDEYEERVVMEPKEEKKTQQKRICISTPREVEEVKSIIDHLLKGDYVVINLEKAEHSNKQRMTDMLKGYGYCNDQILRQVNTDVYVIC